jgi:O-antigen/teichoic acid export membrane protein
MSLSARWITLVTLPIFAIFLFWGAQLTPLWGSSFVVSQAVISWLAVSQFGFIIFGPSGWALSMTGKHVLELKILSVGLVIATLLCWVAVPAFGQLGAAVAACTSMTISNLARVLFVRRYVGAFPFGSDIFVITAAGLALAWGSHMVTAEFSLSSFWNPISGIGCFILAYGIAGWTHLLSESEKSGICGTVRSTARLVFSRAT